MTSGGPEGVSPTSPGSDAASVDEGVLDEFELGPELTDLECFEGRNWYSVFDDPEYDERFQECVYG